MYCKIQAKPFEEALDRLLAIVPSRPLSPVEGQVRLLAHTARPGERASVLIMDATDGRVQARVYVDCEEGEGIDVFPAQRLADFVEYLNGTVTLSVDEKRQATIENTRTHFTTPLLADASFPTLPGPEESYEVLGEFGIADFASGIDRVLYAMGGDRSDERLRMIQVLNGRMSAYSGTRCQEVIVGAPGTDLSVDHEILLVDYAIQPLLRFLRSSPVLSSGRLQVVRRPASEGAQAAYVFVVGPLDIFVVTVPAAPFVDLTNIRRIASEQMETAGILEVDGDEMVDAIKAARLAAPPDRFAVSFDLITPPRVHARIDDANTFDRVLVKGKYTGEEEGRTVTASIEDLLGLLGAFDGETASLLVSTASFAHGSTMPMLQLRDNDGVPGIIAQVE